MNPTLNPAERWPAMSAPVFTGTITISADLFERLYRAALEASSAMDYIGGKGCGDKYQITSQEAAEQKYRAMYVDKTMAIEYPESEALPTIAFGEAIA